MRLANDLFPTLIVVIVVVLLAGMVIYNSNRNQQQVIDAVKQSQQQRLDQTLDEIRKRMKENEWQDVQESLRENKSAR